jgi:hypothetical protein
VLPALYHRIEEYGEEACLVGEATCIQVYKHKGTLFEEGTLYAGKVWVCPVTRTEADMIYRVHPGRSLRSNGRRCGVLHDSEESALEHVMRFV